MTTPPLPTPVSEPRRSKLFAILGISFAAIGLALAVIPSASMYALVALFSALIFATIAMVKKSEGGKAVSIAAIATSTVGLVVAFAVVATSISATAQAVRDEGAAVEQQDAAAEPPTEKEAASVGVQELVVAEAEFGRDPSTPNGWWYLLLLDNTNPQTLLIEVPITLTAKDASDASLGILPLTVTAEPGKNVVSGYFKMDSNIEVMGLGMSIPSTYNSMWSKDADYDYIDVSGVTPGQGIDGVTSVRGDLANISDGEVTGVLVTVIARDEAGKIIAFANANVADLAVGASAGFEAPFDLALPDDTEFEVFVEP